MFLIQYSVKDKDGNIDPNWKTKGKALTEVDAQCSIDAFIESYECVKKYPENYVFRIVEE
jgi:hypothetical protein